MWALIRDMKKGQKLSSEHLSLLDSVGSCLSTASGNTGGMDQSPTIPTWPALLQTFEASHACILSVFIMDMLLNVLSLGSFIYLFLSLLVFILCRRYSNSLAA